MLMDKLREGAQGRIAKVIFWLIILSFALAGVGSYLNAPVDTNPAEVNGEPITTQALETAYRNERARMESQFGESFSQLASNPAYVQQLRKNVLEKLVDQLVLDQQAHSVQIRVGDEQIKDAIRQMPEFEQDGKFSNERYLNLLSRAGYTPQGFSDSIRQDLIRQSWVGGIVASDFALPSEVERADALLQQTRDATLYTVPATHFEKSVSASESELDAYYKANEKRFMSPEMVKVNYLLIDSKELAAKITPSEQEVRDYYDQHQDLYQTAERRHVAHILVTDKDDKAALTKVQDLLAKLKAGDDFAKLAAANSADTLSARKGGELDWFEKGVMDPAFEQAAFALAKPGELSAVVKSKFGYHIVKLLGVEPQTTRPFDAVKGDVANKLKQDKARDSFLEQQQKMADLSFENPDSLDMVAEKLDMKVLASDFFSAAANEYPFSDAKFKQQAFSSDLREQNNNSEVFNLGDDVAVVLHVVDYKPAAVRPLAEVKSDVTAAVKLQKAQAQARAAADQVLALALKGEAVDAALKAVEGKQVEHKALTRNSTEMDASLLQTLFRMAKPVEGKRSVELTSLPNGEQVVLVLNKVGQLDKDPKMKPMLESQLAQAKSTQAYESLLAQARANAKLVYRKLQEQTAE